MVFLRHGFHPDPPVGLTPIPPIGPHFLAPRIEGWDFRYSGTAFNGEVD
jgi:hypothetical protein